MVPYQNFAPVLPPTTNARIPQSKPNSKLSPTPDFPPLCYNNTQPQQQTSSHTTPQNGVDASLSNYKLNQAILFINGLMDMQVINVK